MNLVDKNDPILFTPTEPFNFLEPPFDPIEFSEKLVKTMYSLKGIGLAANQIGVPYSIFAMRGSPENFVCFNPIIVDVSQEIMLLEEGCLTYPGIYIKIKRPKHIRCRFSTPNGDTITKKFTGMTAKIFQHEMTHLRGEIFTKNCSRLSIERAITKARKNGKEYLIKDLMK